MPPRRDRASTSTPVALAAALARDLPAFRPVIVDLTCGPGQLLAGCANGSTEHLLGCDVDRRKKVDSDHFAFIQADLTLLYEPMRQIDFRADCFALNPPWSLNWHTERLVGLADSEVPAVAKLARRLFLMQNAECRMQTIDSTMATLMIALDRLTDVGEGFLIGYTSTLQRLIFDEGAPGSLLVEHIWKRLEIKEMQNAECRMQNEELAEWKKNVNSWNEGPFGSATAIYFSASHHDGPVPAACSRPRFLPRLTAYNSHSGETLSQWQALNEKSEGERLKAEGKQSRYHLSLQDNVIRVRLGLFDTALTKVNHALVKAADRLNDLHGRNPMQVVMQRDERNFILGLLKPGAEWTVAPALRDAVQAAAAAYNAIRAPLVPLPKIQRLGYLDESDDILCVKDLYLAHREMGEGGHGVPGEGPLFRAGIRYPLATRSVRFTRTMLKPNLHGEEEELELSGQELAIIVSSHPADPANPTDPTEFTFMDASLRAPNVKVGNDDGTEAVDFTLQDLVEHFEIPEVRDVAATDPVRYNAFVSQLHQLEQFTA